jgi:hypothetical protein
MKRKLFHVLLATACAAALTFAQGPKGPGGNPGAPAPGTGNGTGVGLDMTAAKTISGDITAIQSAVGAQYPTITVAQTTIKIAPVWFLLESDFELKVGDKVEVLTAPCACVDGSWAAITITSNGVTVELRDSLGLPLWLSGMNGKGGNGNGPNPSAPRTGAPAIDPASITTVSGVVESVTLGAGIQQPTLVVKSGSSSITIKIGPERVLFASDIELKAGVEVSVKYAVCASENVALSLTAGGVTVVFRQDDGRPGWNQ